MRKGFSIKLATAFLKAYARYVAVILRIKVIYHESKGDFSRSLLRENFLVRAVGLLRGFGCVALLFIYFFLAFVGVVTNEEIKLQVTIPVTARKFQEKDEIIAALPEGYFL